MKNLLVTIALALSLVGCEGDEPGEDTTTPERKPESAGDERPPQPASPWEGLVPPEDPQLPF